MKNIFISVLYLLISFSVFAMERADMVVAKDGSGDFTTIQAAINSIPSGNTSWKTIYIKNGVYDEHVMIKNNFISLVGEDRYNTRIEHNLSRTAWYNGEGNKSNTGCGVINIWTNCHDVVIGNMTVKNTYNYDSDSGDDYTEVIRSETGTTHIWVVNADVLCKWKDTFALWGKDNGMYYVNNCHFRGGIDAFCPRGWCYAINCRFTETRDSSPIWLEGVSGLNQKLVVQGGSVHSEKNKSVKLQNQQGSPAFYYLDMLFSDSIASQGTSGPSYYYNIKGNSSYTFYKDNITLEQRKVIDSKWTFTSNNNLMWNPEDDMPAVLPFASLPQPYHKRYCVEPGNYTLKWIGGRNAVSYKVYFGTTSNPSFIADINGTSCDVVLETGKDYYWRVDVVTEEGIVYGETWAFSTKTMPPVDPIDGNLPPSIQMDQPSSSFYEAPAIVSFTAVASDPDGMIKKVDFYANNTLIGTTDNSPYTISYTFTNSGVYAITAKAYDNLGASATSLPVYITVKGDDPINETIPLLKLSCASGYQDEIVGKAWATTNSVATSSKGFKLNYSSSKGGTLISPAIDMNKYLVKELTLNFCSSGGGNRNLNVYISTDSGITYSPAYVQNGAANGVTVPVTFSLSDKISDTGTSFVIKLEAANVVEVWGIGVSGTLKMPTGLEQPSSGQLNLKAYPSVIQDYTSIMFELQESMLVQISLFDINGKLVKQIVDNKWYPVGANSVVCDLNYLAKGIYVCKLYAGKEAISTKIIRK